MLILTLISMTYIADMKFVVYPPSMIAAGSICAAVNGALGAAKCKKVTLHLQNITAIEAVSTVD